MGKWQSCCYVKRFYMLFPRYVRLLRLTHRSVTRFSRWTLRSGVCLSLRPRRTRHVAVRSLTPPISIRGDIDFRLHVATRRSGVLPPSAIPRGGRKKLSAVAPRAAHLAATWWAARQLTRCVCAVCLGRDHLRTTLEVRLFFAQLVYPEPWPLTCNSPLLSFTT